MPLETSSEDFITMNKALLSSLSSAFGSGSFAVDADGDVLFVAASSEVGPIRLWSCGIEVTVEIGSITHGHFDCYDDELNENDKQEAVIRSVIVFLEDLFAGRVVLWQSIDMTAGGWFYPETVGKNPMPERRKFFSLEGIISLWMAHLCG